MATTRTATTAIGSAPFVFVSYSHANKAVAEHLKSDLLARGISVWIDQEGLRAGAKDWEESIRSAVRSANAVVLVASPDSRSSLVVKDELHVADMYGRSVLPFWVDGAAFIEAVPLGRGSTQYIDARQGGYAKAVEELVAVLQGRLPSTGVDDPRPTTPTRPLAAPRNPYKGLRAFGVQDAGDFFGRDAMIANLVQSLQRSLMAADAPEQDARLLAVVGPSGSGKSSVVMAGLLPRLQRGALAGSRDWVYLEPLVPGAHPLEALAIAFSKQLPRRPLETIQADLEGDSTRGLHLLASQLVRQPGSRVVLVFDQFEELFTQTTSEQERQRFIDLLVTAVTEPGGPVIALLTLRADFYDRPMQYADLGKLLQEHHTPVLPMEVTDLRAVIEKPAALPDVQVSFEGDLVGDLLFDVQGQIGALPLLQFTLDQLFERRDGHLLTQGAYREIGGVVGALAQQAESTYIALPSDDHRRLTRTLFLRLIDPGTTEQDLTRRRAALAELKLPNPRESAILNDVAAAFVTARLLTADTVAGVPTIEVSHEVLIRVWPRLSEWVSAARTDILLQHALTEAATDWMRRGRPSDRLYRESQLAEAQAWASRNTPSVDEAAFIEASTAESGRQDIIERKRQARELTMERRARRRQRYFLGAVSVLAIVLIVVAGLERAQATLLQQNYDLLSKSLAVDVINGNDDGPGSLRRAIDTAKDGSVITFKRDMTGTIQLTSGELKIAKNLSIQGPRVGLTIKGAPGFRVFEVGPDFVVTISNLTIAGGHAMTSGNDTTKGDGGGIYNNGGNLTLINTDVSDNNMADAFGGGIYTSGNLILVNSAVSGNYATFGGGGIYNFLVVIAKGSTIAGNRTDGGGGGIRSFESNVYLDNSTIANNTAAIGGGGIDTVGTDKYASKIVARYTTIYGNHASDQGGGIAVENSSGVASNSTATILATILAGNQAPSGPDASGPLSLQCPNLVQDETGASLSYAPAPHAGSVITGKSPNLGPLQDNGGPTQTLALLPGSPAIDAIPSSDTNCGVLSTDQRSHPRPQGNGYDLGAYQVDH